MKYDTDEDGVSDGDEIALGLDPMSAATDGTPDSERTFMQHIGADSENLAAVNTSENPFEVSIDITAAGVAANNLYSQKSGYSNAMKNDAILGITPEFIYTDGLKVEDVIINFTIDNSAVNNYNNKYTGISDEFVGIKRLNVFKFFEDTNMLLPIETFHDVENNRVYTHVDELGTYCLMDMEIWLESLGIIAEDLADNTDMAETSTMRMFSMQKAKTINEESGLNTIANEEVNGEIDVVFLMYVAPSYASMVKDELITTVKNIYDKSDSAHIYFLTSTGGGVFDSIDIYMVNGKEYAENCDEAVTRIKTFNFSATSSKALIYGFRKVNELSLRANSQKHLFIIDDLMYPATATSYDELDYLKKNGFNFGIICDVVNDNLTSYTALSDGNIHNNAIVFSDFVINQIKFPETVKKPLLITSAGLVKLPDDYKDISEMSTWELDTYDYDGDKVPDNAEIYMDLLTKSADGTISYPYFYEVQKQYGDKLFYVEKGLSRIEDDLKSFFGYKFSEFKRTIRILPIQSDPTNPDSDRDGIGDFEEYIHKASTGFNPLKSDEVKIMDNLIDDSNCMSDKKTEYGGSNDGGYVSAEAISKGEYSDDEAETIMRPVLNFRRYVNSTSVFTITPDENSDYIISTSEKSNITVEQKGFLWGYSDLPNESIYDTEVEGQTRVILEKGETYRITIDNFNESINEFKTFDVKIWQDNWVCVPRGAIAQMGNEDTSLITIICLKDDLIKQIIENYAFKARGDKLILEDFNNKSEKQKQKSCEDYSNDILDSISETYTNLSKIGDLATITGVILIESPEFLGPFGLVATLTSGIVLFDSEMRALYVQSLSDSLFKGNFNVKMYIEVSKVKDYPSFQTRTKQQKWWYPWSEGEYGYLNKYVEPYGFLGLFAQNNRYNCIEPVDYYVPENDGNGGIRLKPYAYEMPKR